MKTDHSAAIYRSAMKAWNDSAPRRRSRARFKDYTYGRQWGDVIVTPSGQAMTEGDYATGSGKEPLTNNLIRQLVKSVVGRFRNMLAAEKKPAWLAAVACRNELDELDCRLLEEFLISGCAIQRIVDERRAAGGRGVWVDNVSPSRFFVNRFADPRGSDIELVGMLHDMSLREVMMRFGAGDADRMARLASIYSDAAAGVGAGLLGSAAEEGDTDFDTAAPGRCRVVEVWTLETRSLLKCHDPERASLFYIDRADAGRLAGINRRRRESGRREVDSRVHLSPVWRGYFMAPGGELLHSLDSPYPHGSHPFAVKFYPLTDGEVHPFVEDVIDQQRFVNRLITLIDHVLSFSAKGVLLFPEEAKPDGMEWEEVAAQWSRPNGVIPFSGQKAPVQAYSGSNASGAYELLNTELRLFEQISGVSGALQGQTATGKTGASLYNAQAENSLISLLDLFETFNSFRSARNSQIERSFTSFR